MECVSLLCFCYSAPVYSKYKNDVDMNTTGVTNPVKPIVEKSALIDISQKLY